MIELINIAESTRKDKKYMVEFNDGTVTHFGARNASDYTLHFDKERRNRYINRHLKDLKTNDPKRAGYLSMFILWSKPSFQDGTQYYIDLLKKYNKTGKLTVFKDAVNKLLKEKV